MRKSDEACGSIVIYTDTPKRKIVSSMVVIQLLMGVS